MTAALIPTPVMQFLDADGNPLVGGKVYTYAAGTSTPLATFTDYGGATPNANPVILNSRGEASIWFGTAAYKLELYTAANVLIWTADNVSASTPVVYGTGVAAALAINVGTAGSILVNGGVLGTPSSGLVTNLTGTASININGTVGATTANTGAFTTINASGLVAMAGAATVGTTLGVTGTSTMAAINASGVVTLAGAAATPRTGLVLSGTTTGYHAIELTNTSGDAYYGLLGTAPTDFFSSGATAYDNVISFASGKGISIGQLAGAVTLRVANAAATVTGTLGVTGTSTMGVINAGGKLTTSFAGGGDFVAIFRNTTAATPYTVQIIEPAAAVSGYPMLQVVDSTGATDRFRVNSGTGGTTVGGTLGVTGVVTFSNYGAGTATFSAAGVISSVSDERLKIKDGTIADPIPMMMALEPGYYFGKPEANMGDGRQLGFYAQNVRSAIGPEAAPDPEDQVSLDADGNEVSRTTRPWGYYDRSVLAVAIEALKVHEGRLAALQAEFQSYKNSHP